MIDKELVQQAKEKLGDKNFEYIMEALGITEYDSKNMKCRCPFHQGDTNPSFCYDKQRHRMHCFGCHTNVDIIDAFKREGMTYTEACKKLFELAEMNVSIPLHGVRTAGADYKYPMVPEGFDRTEVENYWERRGIHKNTLDYCDIRADKYGNTVEIVYDLNDVACVVKYKPSHAIDKSRHEPKCWFQTGADKQDLLFMMHKSNPSEPLIICEGLADCMTFIECGFTNVVSPINGAGSFGWISNCWDFLEQFDEIIVASDDDPAGYEMRDEVTRRLGTWRTSYIDIVPNHCQLDGKTYHIDDINDLYRAYGKEAIIKVVSARKSPPVKSVVNFADVPELTPADMDGIDTGLENLDREIYSFYYTTVTLITGRPGAGKSSFINSIAMNAIDKGIPVWLFSGELSAGMLKNWFSLQVAGPRHVQYVKQTIYGKERVYYRVDPGKIKDINKWLDNMMYIYKDDDPKTEDDIIKSMEDSIRKFGTKLLFIDNLMCIILNNRADKLEGQTDFMMRLIDLAKKYKVAIVLVAHPRKRGAAELIDQDVALDDIAGTSALGNLAHRSISLRRISKAEKQKGESEFAQYDVKVTINKDRILGKNDVGVGLYYDVPTRRFYTNYEEYARQCGWDKANYADPIETPDKLIAEQEDEEVFGKVV